MSVVSVVKLENTKMCGHCNRICWNCRI